MTLNLAAINLFRQHHCSQSLIEICRKLNWLKLNSNFNRHRLILFHLNRSKWDGPQALPTTQINTISRKSLPKRPFSRTETQKEMKNKPNISRPQPDNSSQIWTCRNIQTICHYPLPQSSPKRIPSETPNKPSEPKPSDPKPKPRATQPPTCTTISLSSISLSKLGSSRVRIIWTAPTTTTVPISCSTKWKIWRPVALVMLEGRERLDRAPSNLPKTYNLANKTREYGRTSSEPIKPAKNLNLKMAVPTNRICQMSIEGVVSGFVLKSLRFRFTANTTAEYWK